jgi:threonine synthase
MHKHAAWQQCIHPDCGATLDIAEPRFACPDCGGLLDVRYDWDRLDVPKSLAFFEQRWASRSRPQDFSGVWRFRELIPFAADADRVTLGEGQTILQPNDRVGAFVGVRPGRLLLQYEGLNPSGSFKDNGMTGAFTHAKMCGAKRVACASTGNTSASLALYAANSGFVEGVVFVGSGKIAFGKLAQALDHGVRTLQILGDFDACMARVQEVCREYGLYLMNSLNPFRLEGQKAIMYRVLEGLRWEVPDWIVCPGGNLGNSSAFGKAFIELRQLGLIDALPRLAIINAAGAPTLCDLYTGQGLRWNGGRVDAAAVDAYYAKMDAEGRRARTLASAIEINRPVNLAKALRALAATDGVVRAVPDQQILDARAQIARGGLGCEPASAASVAGARLLVEEGVIGRGDRVVCILTGHELKDPNIVVDYHTAGEAALAEKYADYGLTRGTYANPPRQVPDDLDAIVEALDLLTKTR